MKIRARMRIKLTSLCLVSALIFNSICAQADDFSILISGVSQTIEDNIRSNLTLKPEESELDSKSKIKEYEERAIQEITRATQPFGYYAPSISINTDLQQKKVIITINLGKPVRIAEIILQVVGDGATDLRLKDIKQAFNLQPGEIFDHQAYEQGKKALLTQAIQNGYPDAFFSVHRAEVNIDSSLAEIYLTLDTKQRHYFGTLTFSDTALSDQFLDRYSPFQAGDIYSPEKVLILQSRLGQSDYFSKVDVKPQMTDSPIIPINVALEDAKPNHYLLGAGYGTDTGIRGKAAWTRRRLNSFGHRLHAEARLSEVYVKYEVDYIIPGKNPATDSLGIHAGYFEEEYTEKFS
ncbi:MAG: autotransporter assembly complex family protein, partial [Candidatus Berkiella sp.]